VSDPLNLLDEQVDRLGRPASRWESHGDGTAGDDDRASHLAAVAPARVMGEPRPGGHEPRWQAAQSGAAGAHPWLASAAERIGRPYQNSGNQALLPQPSDEDRAVVDDRRLAVLDAAARCSGERAGATRHLEVRDDAGAGTDGGGTVLVMRVNGNRA